MTSTGRRWRPWPATLLLLLLLLATCAAPGRLAAQVAIGGHEFQVHGFASQGFTYSSRNNFLTMPSSQGSFAFTDGGLNVSTSLNEKLRVGAQAYVRNLGDLGRGHVDLDWALADYRFQDWLGVRAGKVKTTLGLYTDTQDAEFLHTWALLPQSVYPADLRSSTLAHTGADLYGEIPLGGGAGNLKYTAYAGYMKQDPREGQYYNAGDFGVPYTSFDAWMEGMDARWNTPVLGLTVGYSFLNVPYRAKGFATFLPEAPSYLCVSTPHHITAAYGEYWRGNWHFAGEYRRDYNPVTVYQAGTTFGNDQSQTKWFVSAAWRITRRLELGTYHSRFYMDRTYMADAPPPAHHIFDQVAAVRFEIARYWNVKVEGHFMDGYGDVFSAHGFYMHSNPGGLQPTTRLLVIRTGWSF